MTKNVYESPPFQRTQFQRHIAYDAIGPTTLRNMGADRRSLCDWLGCEADLAILGTGSVGSVIDQWTKTLATRGCGPWGAVRKAVNLFLRDCALNYVTRDKYNLGEVERSLEVPLDGQTMRALRRTPEAEGENLTPVAVKALTPLLSSKYQAVAARHASATRLYRVQLDILWWNAAPPSTSPLDSPRTPTRRFGP